MDIWIMDYKDNSSSYPAAKDSRGRLGREAKVTKEVTVGLNSPLLRDLKIQDGGLIHESQIMANQSVACPHNVEKERELIGT